MFLKWRGFWETRISIASSISALGSAEGRFTEPRLATTISPFLKLLANDASLKSVRARLSRAEILENLDNCYRELNYLKYQSGDFFSTLEEGGKFLEHDREKSEVEKRKRPSWHAWPFSGLPGR
jgi:hypothetical protein